MGKYLDKFKEKASKGFYEIDKNLSKFQNKSDRSIDEEYNEEIQLDESQNYYNDNFDNFDDVGIQPAQRPESFHYFILENQYKDLERSIRGFKDVFDKTTQTWVTKRKELHCFTDEEAEGILRMAQSHLATDIKLASMSPEVFGKMMTLLFEQLENYFYRIAEYRYGRYNKFTKDGKLISINYDIQGKMKDENKKILIELYNRIWANYSRAIGGKENKYTHDSVRAQESLQQIDNDMYDDNKFNKRRY